MTLLRECDVDAVDHFLHSHSPRSPTSSDSFGDRSDSFGDVSSSSGVFGVVESFRNTSCSYVSNRLLSHLR